MTQAKKAKPKVPAKRNNNKELAVIKDNQKYFEKTYDDGIDNEDLKFPRIKICQASTKDKGDAKPGEFFNTLDKKSLGNKIEYLILSQWKSRAFFNKDLTLRCRAQNHEVASDGEFEGKKCADCEFSKWKDNKEQCREIYNNAVALAGDLQSAVTTDTVLPPIIFSLISLGTKQARNINTAIRMAKGRGYPFFFCMVEATTEHVTHKVGESDQPRLKISGYVQNPKVKEYLFKLSKAYKEMKLNEKFSDNLSEDIEEEKDVEGTVEPTPVDGPAEGDEGEDTQKKFDI